jgi:hypothetical protein
MRLLLKIVIEVVSLILHLNEVDEVYDDWEGCHNPLAVYYMSLETILSRIMSTIDRVYDLC